jgi:uncharacterized protein YjbI with pentapeptide repeats
MPQEKVLLKITDEELIDKINKHQQWIESNEMLGEPAGLSWTDLRGRNFLELFPDHKKWVQSGGKEGTRIKLRQIGFDNSDIRDANLQGADLSKAKFRESHLEGANLSESNLIFAKLGGAWLQEADLTGANLQIAELQGSYLDGATLINTNFRDSNLKSASFIEADLRNSDLQFAKLSGAKLIRADIRGADLCGADLKGAYLSDIIFDWREKTGHFRGVRIADCFGGEVFVRFANDLAWLEDYKATREKWWQKALAYAWRATCDYGRSLWRWARWCLYLAVFFGCLFYLLGPKAFDVAHLPKHPSLWGLISMIYYSVVTFTTLGFGDIIPRTILAAILVMIEVILGYIMLGGLISILANKLARRS